MNNSPYFGSPDILNYEKAKQPYCNRAAINTQQRKNLSTMIRVTLRLPHITACTYLLNRSRQKVFCSQLVDFY